MVNWWEKSEAPNGPLGEENNAGRLDQSLRDGMGIGFVTIAEGTIFPFMLSSAYTARNYGAADAREIEIDILWAFVISVITSAILAYFLRSGITFVYAIGLGVGLSFLYLLRGGLLKLPWAIPIVTPYWSQAQRS
jgi:hypothetical protein